MGLFQKIKALFHKKQPVLGIAFGSGGAKGMAHLGALKAFEEEGISFSIVTGTSIGSIVGSLYAKGYSSSDMSRIIENLNRKEFASAIKPFSDMDFAEKFIEQYVEGDFSSLTLPFAAWATDAETNEGVVLNEGKVARAVTASSAIPPFFRGVEIGGKKLYDGAFSNAIPADLCKEMGADFVVAIDLSAYAKPQEEKGRIARLLGSAMTKFSPVKTLGNSKSRGYDAADVMLRPHLENYEATDVAQEAMDAMFELGYEEAKSQIQAIQQGIKACRKTKKK